MAATSSTVAKKRTASTSAAVPKKNCQSHLTVNLQRRERLPPGPIQKTLILTSVVCASEPSLKVLA